MTGSMPIALLDWTPVLKGSLLGVARVRLGKALILNGVPVLSSNGKVWVSLPGKPLVGADGTALRDARGKQRYAPVVEWAERDANERFSTAVLEAITRDYGPTVLEVAS